MAVKRAASHIRYNTARAALEQELGLIEEDPDAVYRMRSVLAWTQDFQEQGEAAGFPPVTLRRREADHVSLAEIEIAGNTFPAQLVTNDETAFVTQAGNLFSRVFKPYLGDTAS